MGNSRLLNKKILLYTTLLFLLIGCIAETPSEPKLELNFNEVVIEEPFTLERYCIERYDRIFIVQPYFDAEKAVFANLNMSNGLKSLCNRNTVSETISTILFIKDNKVQAYTIAEREIADLVTTDFEKHYTFPIDQKFIMDKERKIHIYNE
jgi:hypothetical protein